MHRPAQLARLVALPREGVVSKHDHALDEQRRPAREQQRQELPVGQRAGGSRGYVQAVAGSSRLLGYAICLLGEDQFGEVGLGVVELRFDSPHANRGERLEIH
jgi:hypothetical protein